MEWNYANYDYVVISAGTVEWNRIVWRKELNMKEGLVHDELFNKL